jgi:hypothetical protein
LTTVLIWLAVIAITLPWELRNVSRGAILYGPIVTKIENVIKTRYPLPADRNSELPDELPSQLSFRHTLPLSMLWNSQKSQDQQACQTIVCFAPRHFIHNVNMSILLLPTSPVMDDLWHTVKESYPYWRADWNGIFTGPAVLFFALNVFFITLGIGFAWKQQGLAGLAPLAVFAFYHVSNAFARTSGGRYIVPVDWITTLYFIAGLFFTITELARAARVSAGSVSDPAMQDTGKNRPQASPLATTAWILLLLFGAGSLVPLSEKIHEPRYANFNTSQTLREYEELIANAGLTTDQIEEFLQLPGSAIRVGRALYPRSYKVGQGEIAFPPYTVLDFPRTGFVLAGPEGSNAVVLPGDVPSHFPHAGDVLVVGCSGPDYIDALAVVLLEDNGTVYTRSPMPELTCPLRQPVCQSNKECE